MENVEESRCATVCGGPCFSQVSPSAPPCLDLPGAAAAFA